IGLFDKYGIYNERELRSRFNILSETYTKTITVEAKLTLAMGRTQILPAALRYLTEVANSVNATAAAGVDNAGQKQLLNALSVTVNALQSALESLEGKLAHEPTGDEYNHAKQARDELVPAMNAVRDAADRLEG